MLFEIYKEHLTSRWRTTALVYHVIIVSNCNIYKNLHEIKIAYLLLLQFPNGSNTFCFIYSSIIFLKRSLVRIGFMEEDPILQTTQSRLVI